jgi:acetyltransferase
MTGTLADLAHSRADLALIALPPTRCPPRWRSSAACAAAPRWCWAPAGGAVHELHHRAPLRHAPAGPNSLGFQRPGLALNASALGPLAATGPLALVSQSGALTASMLDWARHNGVGFSTVVSLGPNTAVELPRCSTSWPPTAPRRASSSTWKASATRGAS